MRRNAALILAALLVLAVAADLASRLVPQWAARTRDHRPEAEGAIEVFNASGRSGAYFVPAGSRTRPIPLLVILHGSGGAGQIMVEQFRALAKARHFAIVAPDSRRLSNGDFTWEVGDHLGEVTPDLMHVLACVEWMPAHLELVIDSLHVLIAGYSGGGSSAPYIASNRPPFTHIAVLHGGVFPGGIGPRRLPAWFSTGEADRYRPVPLVEQAAAALSDLGFGDVSFQSYPGGHELGDTELRDVIQWWLGQ
jgi:poly(3-hydroxybutyrate) depolymerase